MRAFIGRYLIIVSIICGSPSLIAYEHDLAVCAIFQNEARFLKEWIEFYKLIGVQKFYLYDHKSTDNYKEVLEPYIQTGEVDLTIFADKWEFAPDHDWHPDQYRIYNDCLKRVRGKVKWLAIIDIDEFLFPVQHTNLRIVLQDYEDFAGVCVYWVMFGTSDIDVIPENKLMIESLVMRHPTIDAQLKSIVQPDKIIFLNTHKPGRLVPGFDMVYEDKSKVLSLYDDTFDQQRDRSTNILRINHYWTRDKKFLHEVKIPRIEKNYFYIQEDKKSWVLQMAEWMNDTHDITIQKCVKPLREAMGL